MWCYLLGIVVINIEVGCINIFLSGVCMIGFILIVVGFGVDLVNCIIVIQLILSEYFGILVDLLFVVVECLVNVCFELGIWLVGLRCLGNFWFEIINIIFVEVFNLGMKLELLFVVLLD